MIPAYHVLDMLSGSQTYDRFRAPVLLRIRLCVDAGCESYSSVRKRSPDPDECAVLTYAT